MVELRGPDERVMVELRGHSAVKQRLETEATYAHTHTHIHTQKHRLNTQTLHTRIIHKGKQRTY